MLERPASGTLIGVETSAALDIPIVLYSDVDTVLDGPAPLLREAGRTIQRLEHDNIRLVLCSGKTRAELEYVSQELGIRQPFICEHGGAAFIPNGYFAAEPRNAREASGHTLVEFGRPYAAVVQALHRTAGRLGLKVRGFNDMTVDDVARDCRMTRLQARLAKLRDYGEMFRVVDGDEAARARLLRALNGAHLRSIEGTQYDHVGAAVDYGPAIDLLSTVYRRNLRSIVTVGVAAAASEEPVLDLVDLPVVMLGSSARTPVSHPRAAIAFADDVGTWAKALEGIVAKIRGRSGCADEAPAEIAEELNRE